MLPSELLKKGWTQRAFWRDKDGMYSNKEDATSYCMIGAIYASDLEFNKKIDINDYVSSILEKRYLTESCPTMSWQDSLPYNEASKAKVISIMLEAEVKAGVREKESECNSLANSSNKDGVKTISEKTRTETYSPTKSGKNTLNSSHSDALLAQS